MCDDCTGGLTSLDNGFGQPTYCERCTVGLGLAMTALAKYMADLVESEQARVDRAMAEGRLNNSFSLARSRASERLLAGCIAEYDRLESLYLALGGYSATAAAR